MDKGKLNANFPHVGHWSSRSNKFHKTDRSAACNILRWRYEWELQCYCVLKGSPTSSSNYWWCGNAWTVTSPLYSLLEQLEKNGTLCVLCVPSMILFTNCTPIMLYACSFRVTQDPSAWISANTIASIYHCCFVFIHSHDWAGLADLAAQLIFGS